VHVPMGDAMMYLVESDQRGKFVRELMGMHRLRYRVFKQRLDWDVTVSGDMEIDEYDALNPLYLLCCNAAGDVEGCARLLPTSGPNMLRNSFPSLLGPSTLPESPRIWEASRLCVEVVQPHRDHTRSGSSLATIELFAALIEFGLARGLSDIVAVTDHRMERILRRVGVPWRRIHQPQPIGNSIAVAGFTEVSVELLDRLCKIGKLKTPLLNEPLRLKESA
jgi:acyl homoserine lactone synthase